MGPCLFLKQSSCCLISQLDDGDAWYACDAWLGPQAVVETVGLLVCYGCLIPPNDKQIVNGKVNE